ncbi:hypothetical protein ACQBAU_15790 [Propionibacteriaceae bacterium Y2011]
MATSSHVLSRRSLIGGALGAAVVGTAACTSGQGGGSQSGGEVRGAGLSMPTFQTLSATPPDLPGDSLGVPEGYLSYPRPAKSVTSETPGRGGEITALLPQEVQPPVPMEQNAWWQGLNERLGTKLSMQFVASEYPAKLTTVVAGGDLPDVIEFPHTFPRLPDVLEAMCEDLTDHFAGDAVLDYPALANLSTTSWQSMVQGGRIRAMPAQNIVGSGTWIVRGEITEKLGVSLTPGNADEVLSMAKEVTDRNNNQFAFAVPYHVLSALGCTMWNSPNNWAQVDGKFVKNEETDEFAAALEWTTKAWQAGVLHPESFGTINTPGLYQSGSVVFYNWGGIGWGQMLNDNFGDLDMQFMLTPAAEGGGPGNQRLGRGIVGLVAIKKQQDPERVREIINVINYLASPFGSAEELYTRWGEEGVHHTWDAELQTPVLTDKGLNEIARETAYIGCNPYVAFNPGYSDKTEAFHELQQIVIPNGRSDDTIGLSSTTDSSKGPGLTRDLNDGIFQIIRGQRSQSDLTALLDDFRKDGGDKIRAEYEEAFEKSQSE